MVVGIFIDEKADHVASNESCAMLVISIFLCFIFFQIFNTFFQRVCPIGDFHAESFFELGLVEYGVGGTGHFRGEFVAVAWLNVAALLPAYSAIILVKSYHEQTPSLE